MESYRKDNSYVVRVDLPGVDPKDVSVQAENNVLTISGERKSAETSADYRETFYGKFERSVTLPQGMETDKIVGVDRVKSLQAVEKLKITLGMATPRIE